MKAYIVATELKTCLENTKMHNFHVKNQNMLGGHPFPELRCTCGTWTTKFLDSPLPGTSTFSMNYCIPRMYTRSQIQLGRPWKSCKLHQRGSGTKPSNPQVAVPNYFDQFTVIYNHVAVYIYYGDSNSSV